jgi:hypothetical protein
MNSVANATVSLSGIPERISSPTATAGSVLFCTHERRRPAADKEQLSSPARPFCAGCGGGSKKPLHERVLLEPGDFAQDALPGFTRRKAHRFFPTQAGNRFDLLRRLVFDVGYRSHLGFSRLNIPALRQPGDDIRRHGGDLLRACQGRPRARQACRTRRPLAAELQSFR